LFFSYAILLTDHQLTLENVEFQQAAIPEILLLSVHEEIEERLLKYREVFMHCKGMRSDRDDHFP